MDPSSYSHPLPPPPHGMALNAAQIPLPSSRSSSIVGSLSPPDPLAAPAYGVSTTSPTSHQLQAASSAINGDGPGDGLGFNPSAAVPLGADGNLAREPTVPSACLQCRSKHLKCDGQNPCSRCIASESECVYIASRRGYKGPRRGTTANPNKRQATSPPDAGDDVQTGMARPGGIGSSPDNGPSLSTTPGGLSGPQLYQSYCSAMGEDPLTTSLIQRNGSGTGSSAVTVHEIPLPERCLDSFYHHFHAAHPFALPKPFLLQATKEHRMEPLLAAMRWAGSLYIDVGATTRAELLDEALRLIYDLQALQDGFLLQAMMVLIVALDGSCQQDRAREVLGDAERLAVQIAINTRPYATLHGAGLPVMEESWRRTWWDLFVIDGMIAGVHRVTNFLLYDLPSDVALPCEEHQFIAGVIPRPMYLEDVEDRDFSLDDREPSSFAYRVLCARNLGRLMRSPPSFSPEDESLARIEALLTNWRLHLPAAKRDALHRDGAPDEMMFQALMMSHATSILLHQPHSQLDSSPARGVNSCAPHRGVAAGDAFNAHTRHTVASANEISRLVTLRVPLLSHTHFFTCVVTLSSIVHLSKWALNFVAHDDDDLRQQIRLNLGALNRLADVWRAADVARGQVKAVAHEIYQVKKQQQLNPHYWLGFSQDEVVNSIAADENIITDIDSFQGLPGIPPGMMG